MNFLVSSASTARQSLYRRSLAIREKALGPDHPDVAISLNNLAALLMDQAQYAEAEPLYRRSLAINEKALGLDHPDVAMSLNNLAGLLDDQGQYTAAEPLYRRSLAIREKVLGPDHPDVAISLNNLAGLLRHQGQYAAAVPLLRRSLAINEKVLGPDHPDVATSLNNLAVTLMEQGQYAAAVPLLRRSLAIREKALGADHPDVAISLISLARLLIDQGRYAEAEPLLRRSIAINEKALKPDHPHFATTLSNLAGFYVIQRQYSKAELFLARALAAEFLWLTRELPLETWQVRSTLSKSNGTAWLVPFTIVGEVQSGPELAFTTRLNRHGLLQEVERRQALLASSSSIPREKVDQLRALNTQLSSVTLPMERRAALRDERDRLQAELYRALPELQIQPVSTVKVAQALPADAALIEFQRFLSFDGRKPANQRWGEPRYLALILKQDGSIQPVQLGLAAPIDAAVQKGLAATAQNQSDSKAIWGQLSDLVLRPLLPYLSGSRQWFLSPDGELNRVPFAALPSPQQSDVPLAEAVQLRQLTTGRDLLRLQQPAAKSLQKNHLSASVFHSYN